MRVNCPHCDEKSIITSSHQLSKTVKELYCQCTNTADCGASFVYSLAFKHDLTPPRKTVMQMAAALLGQLSRDERAAIQRDLFK